MRSTPTILTLLRPAALAATALAAAIGTLIMGLWARYPFALAPGMGINAYFTYTVVLGNVGTDTATGVEVTDLLPAGFEIDNPRIASSEPTGTMWKGSPVETTWQGRPVMRMSDASMPSAAATSSALAVSVRKVGRRWFMNLTYTF